LEPVSEEGADSPILRGSQERTEGMPTLSITARLATTAVAGLAGYAAVGIYTLLAGTPQRFLDLAVLMLLFTAVYVPDVFGARAVIDTFAAQPAKLVRATTR
jgi:hypothetical protein